MAKRIIGFLSVVTLVFSLTACGSRDTEGQAVQSEQTESRMMEDVSPIPETAKGGSETDSYGTSEEDENGKVLVAYFSWAENAVQDDIDAMTSASVKAPGNVA